MKPWESIPPLGPLLRPKQAAVFLGIATSSYYRLMAEGRVPPTVQIGEGSSSAAGVPVSWLNSVIAEAAAGEVIG
jgi:predicted DNA-binding transcriptional regulator AlpA